MQSETNADVAAPVGNRRINYVLIDHENVQPTDLALLDRDNVRLWVFVGATQAKLSSDLAIQMQAMRERADYVRISGNGSNALDFHIALYIGQKVCEDPRGFFHIISRDTGFDPLVTHLKSKKIFACRSASISEMPLFKRAPSKTPPYAAVSATDKASKPTSTTCAHTSSKPVASASNKSKNPAQRVDAVRTTLNKMGKARPTKLASLKNHVSALFQKQIKDAEIDLLIAALQSSGVLKVDNNKVAYR